MLIKKDIEKKKQALEEEKQLIEERLNKRKEAEDEAEKYEELAELRRQLALVSADSTRTKDAAALREKIGKLEKEIAWDAAEDEVKAQEEAMDDQTRAYDQYVANGDEDLEAFLADANNFAIEANRLIEGSQEELFDWLKENVKEYAQSLAAAQRNMVESWTDTFKQMRGIVDKWWPLIDDILGDKDTFMNYMRESETYQYAQDENRAELEYQWGKMYDDYIAARLDYASWQHSDDFDSIGTEASSGNGGTSKLYTWNVLGGDYDHITYSDKIEANTESGAIAIFKARHKDKKFQYIQAIKLTGNTYSDSTPGYNNLINPEESFNKFASGGLVDFTGPAWVDGTPSRPEAFLSAEDTALIRKWLDSAQLVNLRPNISNIDGTMFNGSGVSIGNVNIEITEASFANDADIDAVAQRVGDAFVKELSKQGFRTPNYAF